MIMYYICSFIIVSVCRRRSHSRVLDWLTNKQLKNWNMKMKSWKNILTNARSCWIVKTKSFTAVSRFTMKQIAVISKTIHVLALFEKLPTYSAVKASIAHDPMDCDPDQDVEVMEMKKNLMPFVSPIASSYTNRRVSRSIRSSAVKKSHSSVSGSLAMIDFKDEDFLPPG